MRCVDDVGDVTGRVKSRLVVEKNLEPAIIATRDLRFPLIA